MAKRGPKNIPWETISAEDWAKGYVHVGRLAGVTGGAARAAYLKLSGGLPVRKLPVPEGLRPTDSPAAVAKAHGVSAYTARKWLASVGRPSGHHAGRPPQPSKWNLRLAKWSLDPDKLAALDHATWREDAPGGEYEPLFSQWPPAPRLGNNASPRQRGGRSGADDEK